MEYVVYSYRLPFELKRRLEACAMKDKRSIAQLMSIILEGWVDGDPYVPTYNPAEVAPRPDDGTLGKPGRPRLINAITTDCEGFLPVILPLLADRDAITVDEIFDQTALRNDKGTRKMLTELFGVIGWYERRERTGAIIWLSPKHPDAPVK